MANNVIKAIEIFKLDNGLTLIKITSPSGGFDYGKKVERIYLNEEEVVKLKELL